VGPRLRSPSLFSFKDNSMSFLNAIPPAKLRKLIANGDQARIEIEQGEGNTKDCFPVLHVTIGGTAQYLFTEYDEEMQTFFGLCDLGAGFPELGYVGLGELDALPFPLIPVVNEVFEGRARLTTYAKAAHARQQITLAVKSEPET
jgi:hypothetical protein